MSFLVKAMIKKAILFLNDATVSTRFYFDGEYERWKKLRKDSTAESDTSKEMQNIGSNPKIFYLVPGVAISGGIAVVLQHANRLCERDYDVKILSLNNVNNADWFPGQKVEIFPYRETKKILKSGEIDILIATAYSTAFTADMTRAKRKIYFVQSDESRFFHKDKRLCEIIRKTYALPLEYMTEARWIQRWLKEDFGHETFYVPNGLDEDIIYQTNPILKKGERKRVLIEGSIDIPFKGMIDAYNAIKDLDCDIWIVSSCGKPKKGWRYDKFFEAVPMNEMHEIYSSCDIFLKMSRIEGFFGPPMEAMACGCAVVVGKVTGYEEYINDGYNALVVEQGDAEGAKKAVQRLMENEDLRKKLIENGYKTAKEWNWDRSIDLLEEVIKK